MYQTQAAVAMEQEQIRSDFIGVAAARVCFGTRSNAVSSHQDLIPEPHSRTFKRIAKKVVKKDFLYSKIFIQELCVNIPEEFAYKHQCRASARSCCKDLLRMIPTGSPQVLLTGTCTRSCKDPLEDFTRITTRVSHKEL